MAQKVEELKLVNPEEQTEFDEVWFKKEYDNCFIDITKPVERPEILISIGSHSHNGQQYPTPVMTAGEYSCISAPSKHKKSYLKSQFVASYVGGKADNHFPSIKGHREEDYYIFDCDTEQSKYYAHRTFKRVKQITGQHYKNYLPFKLRHLDPEQRVAFIDNLIESPEYKGKVKLIFIDGIADLIEDTNDLHSSNYIVGKLLKWTDIYNIHVCVVIHNKYGEKKPTGHLGTATLKKAETVMFIEKDEKNKDIVHVTQDYSRGVGFKDFSFKINDHDALPYECDSVGNIIAHIEEEMIDEFIPDNPKPIEPKEEFDDIPF